MDFKEFRVGINDIDRRIDKVIRIFIPELTLSSIYKYIRKGLIKINGKKTDCDYRIKENDLICVASFILIQDSANKENSKPALQKSPSADLSSLKIVFENSHILILDKPYDTLVHGDDNSLEKKVNSYYFSKNSRESLSFTPGPLHRLDRKTSGLIAFSKSIEGAHEFSALIKEHSIRKFYYGIVQGKILQEQNWDDFILKDENETNNHNFHKVKSLKNNDDDKAKRAVTAVKPIALGSCNNIPVTFVEFEIKTGRTHQIRAQSSLHNCPLLGDDVYGGTKLGSGFQTFYLQSYRLLIPENKIGLPSEIKIPLSHDFESFLLYCGIKNLGL